MDLEDDQMVKGKKLPIGLKIRKAIIWSKFAKWTSYVIAAFIGYVMIFGGADSSASSEPVKLKPKKEIGALMVPGALVDASAVMDFGTSYMCTGVVIAKGYWWVLYKSVDGFGERHDYSVKVGFGSDYVITSGWLMEGKRKICDVRRFL